MSDDVDTAGAGGTTPVAERAARPFFHSRWVQAPAHVRELGLAASLPAGFRAAGAAAGIKPSGNPDVGLLVCDAERPVSAARFTTSAAVAAPVLVSRERCQLQALRAVLANSGCANAATGKRGLDDAAKTQGAAAAALGLDPAHVALASTGGISQYLPVEQVLRGILDARPRLSAEGAGAFQRAIQTTDAFEKRANLEVALPGGVVRLSAQCKGAGMISPRFATMLCFVETDALLSAETAELLLGVCVKRSFDRVSVDGQLSTNDTAILMCSGASAVEVAPHSEEELRLGEALDALLRALAIMLVADGEGAGRIARVLVRGGEAVRCESAARAVANSPLVKAALHGGDPNWGRIVQAIGGALGEADAPSPPLALDVTIEGIQVCSAGAAIPYDEPALAKAVAREEVEYEVTLGARDSIHAETEVFFSDLSHEYVTVNADYTT
jgi:glutamate N-acetyltransferase/amino-acid N-acetyltransferase